MIRKAKVGKAVAKKVAARKLPAPTGPAPGVSLPPTATIISETDEIERTYYKFQGEVKNSYGENVMKVTGDPLEGDLISSELAGTPGWHAPVIDLDFPCELVPSTTPGHYHLYINKAITWEAYRALLTGLHDAGLIQRGWYRNALRDGRSYVRRKGVYKTYNELKDWIATNGLFGK